MPVIFLARRACSFLCVEEFTTSTSGAGAAGTAGGSGGGVADLDLDPSAVVLGVGMEGFFLAARASALFPSMQSL